MTPTIQISIAVLYQSIIQCYSLTLTAVLAFVEEICEGRPPVVPVAISNIEHTYRTYIAGRCEQPQ